MGYERLIKWGHPFRFCAGHGWSYKGVCYLRLINSARTYRSCELNESANFIQHHLHDMSWILLCVTREVRQTDMSSRGKECKCGPEFLPLLSEGHVPLRTSRALYMGDHDIQWR